MILLNLWLLSAHLCFRPGIGLFLEEGVSMKKLTQKYRRILEECRFCPVALNEVLESEGPRYEQK
jgi:hypothetical protein